MTVRQFPALGFDPAPGTPAALAAAGQSVDGCATNLGRSAETLAHLDSSTWVGEAADAFRTTLGDLPRDLDHATRAHAETARALSEYGQTLEGMQARAADLERQAEEAQRRQQAAVAEVNRIAAIRLPSDDPRLADLRTQYNSARSSAQTAGNDLEQLRAQARSLREQARGAAQSAARRIRGATDPPYDKPGWLKRAWDATTDWIKEHADVLQAISGVLKAVAGVTGLLALIPGLQWLGVVALVAGGAALAIDVAVKLVTGKGSWGAIAFDAVTMLPAGKLLSAGKALVGGEKALVGAERAIGAERALAGGERALASGERAAAGGERALASGEGAARGAAGEAAETGTPLAERICASDPVDVATGQVVLGQVDVELPGVLPLVFTRTHISSYRAGRWFGPSWASTMDQRLEVDEAGACYTSADGMVLVYPPAGAEPVLPEHGPRLPLAATTGGYTVTDPRTGQTMHFAEVAGRLPGVLPLVALTNRNGDRIEVDYGPGGVPEQLRHSGGYRVGIDTAAGRVTALRLDDGSPQGTVLLRYGYDAGGRLVEVINSAGRPLRIGYDQAGRITGWTDRNGTGYRYRYDDTGRCVRTEGSEGFLTAEFRYDPAARVTTVTNSLDHTTTYEYDSAGRVVREVDPLGNTTLSEWDGQRRLVARTDPLHRTTRYDYDPDGNLTAVHRPDGHRSRATYNALGLPLTVIQADGATWRHEYDQRGNLTAVTDPMGGTTVAAYDAGGHLTAVTDALGHRRLVETDGAGLPVAVTDPLGATTRYARDGFGRVVGVTDPLGGATAYAYAVEGQLTARTRPDGGTERWAYDPEGNLVEHTDAAGQRTRIEVGAFDLPTARTTPDGARLEFGYDTELRLTTVTNPQGLVWRYDYDPAGRLVAETDFNGRVVRYGLDAAGQLVTRTNGAGELTEYRRDALGNVVRRRSGELVSRYAYDPAGRLLRATNPVADLAFERDALGRILVEACNGQAIESSYDALGRRVRRRTPSGAESSWEYDGRARPVALHSAGHTVLFGYDAGGREVERRLGAAAVLAQTWDAGSRLLSQTLLVQPAGGAAPAALDRSTPGAGGRLVQRRAYRYRPDGHLVGVEDRLAGDRSYELDPVGRVTAVHAAGWAERYAYDAAGNVTDASWPATGADGEAAQGPRDYAGTLIRRAGAIRYEHDRQGRVTLRQQRRPSGKPRTWRYHWDGEDRLTGVATPDGQRWQYRYDPLGRRIAKQRLDADGVVLEQLDFAWDGQVLAEQTHRDWWPGDGEPIASRATVWDWEPGRFRPVSQVERVPAADADQRWIDERFYAIVTDLVGSPAELVTTAGEIAWRPRTTLWGSEPADSAGEVDCPLRFPGQYHDPETQLNYNYQRHYDPVAARYHSGDPLGLGGGDNPHGYVVAPTSWSDPLGLTPCKSGLPIPDNYPVVRGGTSDMPPAGQVFSGAAGSTVEKAAGAVPHGQVRVSTAGEIRAGGGTVEHIPEPAPSGIMNERHVNVTTGEGSTPFGPLEKNPVPTKQRMTPERIGTLD